ncbi:VOC family protein [Streptomyces shenzhenensis]|uniref:VOC family protein n=1 Tax=Streptomyces shenzhenensis TaxID=943815 RepID=UPI0033D8642F
MNVRDFDRDLSFFTEVLGMRAVGEGSDGLTGSARQALTGSALPRLFDLAPGASVDFRSQLVAPEGDDGAFYEVFQWISPASPDDEWYAPSNHVGLFRSQMQVVGYDDLKRKIAASDRAEFINSEVRWAGAIAPNDPPSYTRAGSIRHDSGAVFQIKQAENAELDALPGRSAKINHRAIHTRDIEASFRFYTEVFGVQLQTEWGPQGHLEMLTATSVSPQYVHYLTEYQVPQIFGIDQAKTPVTNFDSGFLTVQGVNGGAQNLDFFQWLTPRAVGEPYSSTIHLGLQRLSFFVEDFDDVKSRVATRARRVIAEEVALPDVFLPGVDRAASRAMSLLDPDGVFLLVLG